MWLSFFFKKDFLHSSGVTLFHQFHVYFLSHEVCFYKGHKRDTLFLRRLDFFDGKTLAANEWDTFEKNWHGFSKTKFLRCLCACWGRKYRQGKVTGSWNGRETELWVFTGLTAVESTFPLARQYCTAATRTELSVVLQFILSVMALYCWGPSASVETQKKNQRVKHLLTFSMQWS